MTKLDPVTPGELLLEEFLTPMGISKYRLAKEIGGYPRNELAKLYLVGVLLLPIQT
jgi:plasmid maintenance system antidote protein VapI